MWYCSPSETQHGPAPPNEIVGSDPHTIEPEDVESDEESDERSFAGNAPARSKADVAPIGPGSEYWLP